MPISSLSHPALMPIGFLGGRERREEIKGILVAEKRVWCDLPHAALTYSLFIPSTKKLQPLVSKLHCTLQKKKPILLLTHI